MKKEIPIMFCFDKNYVIPASVAFYSLMENSSKNYNYVFYILHSDINNDQQKLLKDTLKEFSNVKLVFKNMEHKLNDEWNRSYRGDHFSKEVMYKLLTASLFPQYDFIIVSDVDVIFTGDVSKALNYFDDIKDFFIAGTKPIGKVSNYFINYESQWSKDEIKKLGEVCGGFLIMNLKKIREDNVEVKFLNSLDENSYRLNQMEQDILNLVCYKKIYHLPLNYVACSYMWDYFKTPEDMKTDSNYSYKEIKSALKEPIQLHYATSIKPWKNVNCTKSDVWFKYIVKTPFLKIYLDELPNKIVIPEYRINVYVEKKHSRLYKFLSYVKKNPFFIFKKEFYRKLVNNVKRK